MLNPLKRHVSKSAVQASASDQAFSRVAESGRIIREYCGFLPCTGLSARHILRCEHLRQLPGEGLPPFRVEPQFTHQLWLWYREQSQPEQLRLIFRGQFEFEVPGKDADGVAAEVTDFLAYLLLQTTDSRLAMRHPESDLFWADAVAAHLEDLYSSTAVAS